MHHRAIVSLLISLTLGLAWLPRTCAQGTAVPAPEQYLGHRVGEDYKLARWDKIQGYFRKVAETSERVRIEDIGLSSEGRKMVLGVIAHPQTLRDLERHRQDQQKIADPRLIRDDAEKKRLAETS